MDSACPTFSWADGPSKGDSSVEPAPFFGSRSSSEGSFLSPAPSADGLEPFPVAVDERARSAAASSSGSNTRPSNNFCHSGDGNVAAGVTKRSADHESRTPLAPNDIPVISRRQKKRKGLPKRALSAYHLFFQREREDIMESGADELDGQRPSFGELEKLIAKRWQRLPTEERQKFERLAADDSHRYRTEMEAFNDEKKSRVAGGNDKANPSSKQQHQKQQSQIQRQDEETRQYIPGGPLPPPHKTPSHPYRGSCSPTNQGRPTIPPMYGVGCDFGSKSASLEYIRDNARGYEHYPPSFGNPPDVMHAQAAPRYPSNMSRDRSGTGSSNHQQLPASGSPTPQIWREQSYHAAYMNGDVEMPPPYSRAARPQSRPSPRSSATEVPHPPHHLTMGHANRSSEDNNNHFPIPPGMELLLPDRNGRERKYRVEYNCYTMTREAAQEYMRRLGAKAFPRQHHPHQHHYQP